MDTLAPRPPMPSVAPTPLRLGRVAAAILALVVAAWFVLAARQAHDTASAQAIVTGRLTLSPRSASRIYSLLDSAGTLNPDRMVKLIRAETEIEQARNRQAIALLLSVAKDEPLNREVWAFLARAAVDDEPALTQKAIVRLGALEPPMKNGPSGF